MNSERKKVENITGGVVRYILIDELMQKNYIIETDECYIKCKLIDNQLYIIENYETEEEWTSLMN